MKKSTNNKNQKKKIVMVFGTFDLLHKGHLNYFKQAKNYGKILVAVVARDKTVFSVKKRKPLENEKTRLKNVKNYVDIAVLGGIGNKYAVIRKIKPDVICIGYDQNSFTDKLKKELNLMNLKVKIVRLKSYKPKKYKTKIIRKKLNK